MGLDVQMRAGRLPSIADLGDLLAGSHLLSRAHEVLVDVAVDGDRPVRVLDIDGQTEAVRRPASSTTPEAGAKIGVPMGAAMSTPLCIAPDRLP